MSKIKVIVVKIIKWEKERDIIIDLLKSVKSKWVRCSLEGQLETINDIINDMNDIKNAK